MRSSTTMACALALGAWLVSPVASAAPPTNKDPFGLDEVYADDAANEGTTPSPDSVTDPVADAVTEPPSEAPSPERVEAQAPEAEGPEPLTDMAGEVATSLLDAQSADMIPLDRVLAPASGKKMMIGGGISYGLGFLGQLTGWGVIRRTCATTPAESVQGGDFLGAFSCGAGFAGGSVLLFFSAIPEFAGAPWLVAGATFNGRNRAFNDHFFKGYGATRGKKMDAYVWSGAALIAAGALSWIVSPVVAVRSCVSNPNLTCSVDATTLGFNFGLGAMTAGGALLGHGIAYRKAFGRYRMLTPVSRPKVSFSPTFGRDQAGMSLRGKF